MIYLKQGGTAFTFDVFKPAKPSGKAIVWLISGGWGSSHEGIDPNSAKPLNDAGFTVFAVVHGSQPKYTIMEIIPRKLQHAIRFIHANAKSVRHRPARDRRYRRQLGRAFVVNARRAGRRRQPGCIEPGRPSERQSGGCGGVHAANRLPELGRGRGGAVEDSDYVDLHARVRGEQIHARRDLSKSSATIFSPINTIKSDFPPTLIVQGDKDGLAPPQQAHRMDDALGAAKIDHKLVIVPGGGHDGKTIQGGFAQMIEWFNSHLKVAG